MRVALTPRSPVGELRLAALVERAGRIDHPKGTAALEVGADDGRQRLAAAVFVAKAGDGQRQLGGADAGDLDAELRQGGWRDQPQGQQAGAGSQGRGELASSDRHHAGVESGAGDWVPSRPPINSANALADPLPR